MTTHTVITLVLLVIVVLQQTRISALKNQNDRIRENNLRLAKKNKCLWEHLQGYSEPKSRFF